MDSFLSYMGGKSKLAPFICSLFPPHECYVEVFGGAAWVLFYKNLSKKEVYNDVNNDLVNVFWQIRSNFNKLAERIYWLPYSRELYKKFLKTFQDRKLSGLERAIRFLYVNKVAFSGQYQTNISAGPTHSPNWHTKFFRELEKVRERLDNVIIECLDFEECIKRYDRQTTLFYLDPPYWTSSGTEYYKFLFSRGSHERLRNCLLNIKGKCIVSYENIAEVREMYKNFYIYETPTVSISSSVKDKKTVTTELCITNFKAKIQQKTLFE